MLMECSWTPWTPWALHEHSTKTPWSPWALHKHSMSTPQRLHGLHEHSMSTPWTLHEHSMSTPWTLHRLYEYSMSTPWALHGKVWGSVKYRSFVGWYEFIVPICIPEEKTGIVPNSWYVFELDAVDFNPSVIQVPCNKARKRREWRAKNCR